MAHHLDTPLALQNGQLRNDDLYVHEANGSRWASPGPSPVPTSPRFSHEAPC